MSRISKNTELMQPKNCLTLSFREVLQATAEQKQQKIDLVDILFAP